MRTQHEAATRPPEGNPGIRKPGLIRTAWEIRTTTKITENWGIEGRASTYPALTPSDGQHYRKSPNRTQKGHPQCVLGRCRCGCCGILGGHLPTHGVRRVRWDRTISLQPSIRKCNSRLGCGGTPNNVEQHGSYLLIWGIRKSTCGGGMSWICWCKATNSDADALAATTKPNPTRRRHKGYNSLKALLMSSICWLFRLEYPDNLGADNP